MIQLRDAFLSDEDLDLKTLTDEALEAHWNIWLEQAQVTNERDQHTYSHGVFTHEPPWDQKSIPRPGASAQVIPRPPAPRFPKRLPTTHSKIQ